MIPASAMIAALSYVRFGSQLGRCIDPRLLLGRPFRFHPPRPAEEIRLTIPGLNTVRTGGEVRLLLPPSPQSDRGRHDPALIALVAKAWTARQALTSPAGISVDEAATEMGLKADYFRVLVRISFLAPDIVAAILEGRQAAMLTRQKWPA